MSKIIFNEKKSKIIFIENEQNLFGLYKPQIEGFMRADVRLQMSKFISMYDYFTELVLIYFALSSVTN